VKKINFIAIMVLAGACTFILPGYNSLKRPTWLSHVKKVLSAKTNVPLEVQDKSGTPILLTLYSLDANNPQVIPFIPELSLVDAQAFASSTLDLLKAYPEITTTVSDYKPFDLYFKKVGIDNVDWSLVHEKIIIFEESEARDFQKRLFSLAQDAKAWIIIAQNWKTKEVVGFLKFLISEAWGNVHIRKIGFMPAEQRKGLGKQIISSLFTFLPSLQRIDLQVLKTNANACNAYHAYGFRQYTPPINRIDEYAPYELDLEYKADQFDILQKVAANHVGLLKKCSG